jgi:DNA repair protein RadD
VTILLRPYQQSALAALHEHICAKQTNPCVVLPTGSGKSVVMAEMIRRWKAEAPWVRGMVLAHRKELVEQNAEKMRTIWPEGDIGVYSAGLGRRDYESSVLFASIDSVFKRSGDFEPFDFLYVDEAHRIPPKGEGKYRTFIAGCKRFNKELRVVGWTATPFRMACGPICHKDHILNEVSYESKITDLIHDGYLCQLRSKVGVTQPELSDVKRNSGGDYIINSLALATNKDAIVSAAVSEAVRIMEAENRRAVIFFCVDVAHCQRVSLELRRHGIYAPFVTGKTRQHERDQIIRDFKIGRLRAVCNVNVLTEGFDAPHVDCIVLLRPTLSPGLFSQMVGRGLRVSPGKADCLVLDFAGCIDEHGPVDLLGGKPIVMAVCQQCRESFSRAIGACPACGWAIPKQEVDHLEAQERQKRLHGDRASSRSILSTEPETHKVDEVFVTRHVKAGSPDSLRVGYRCGLSQFREWVCLDHPGPAGQMAQAWWRKRFAVTRGHMVTVNEALANLFLAQELKEWTKTITIRLDGKWWEVVGHNQPVTEVGA